jgi:streptomycin 6-kinase
VRPTLRDLATRWQRYWPQADVARIVADVEARAHAARVAWDLPSLEPLHGGVVALTCAAGDVVVKVVPRHHPEEALMRGEGEALAHWAATGAAVPLLDRRDDGMTLLLPRLRPASSLDDLPYDDQLAEAGALVARLHAAGPAPRDLPSIEDHVAIYRRVPDPELDRLLESTAGDPVAVHADLHGGNVLLDGDRWVAIDPKGVRGDRHLDIWLLVCPQAPPLPSDPGAARAEAQRRVDLYATAARLDPARAAAWARVVARAEAVLSADSAFEGWPGRLRALASALS